MSNITLHQVAVKAGVSKTTASLVLNGKADSVNIAQATRQRVIEAAQSLNYSPGKFNPGKLNGRSGIIGVFSNDFIGSNNRSWLQHLIKAAEEKGFVILPQLATPQNIANKIQAVPYDAAIILKKGLENDEAGLTNLNPPLICAGFSANSASVKSIIPDFEKQTNELIQMLYQHNKKAIGLLCTNDNTAEQQQKTKTYRENYCERFDIAPNIEELSSGDLKGKEIKEVCFHLIEKGANGIIFETPEMTSVAMREGEIRKMVKDGILFAAYDKIDGSELLPENLLIYTTPDFGEMAKRVMGIEEPPKSPQGGL